MQAKVGNPTTKLGLQKLADHASDIRDCSPSYDNMANVCEASSRRASTHVQKLDALGLFTKTTRKREKDHARNTHKP